MLLDIATADVTWLAWSEGQFRTAAAQGPIRINPIIYAELAPAFASQASAEAERLTLVTRDAGRFRAYFPNVALVVPS